jgi:hypothetical protein
MNNQVEENEMGGHIARIGEKRNECSLLVRKPGSKKALSRPRHAWLYKGV